MRILSLTFWHVTKVKKMKMKNWEKRVEEIGKMSNRELREKTKHRTFTSMAQRRRWLALQGMLEEKKEKNGDE